jgi:hypothetical protein
MLIVYLFIFFFSLLASLVFFHKGNIFLLINEVLFYTAVFVFDSVIFILDVFNFILDQVNLISTLTPEKLIYNLLGVLEYTLCFMTELFFLVIDGIKYWVTDFIYFFNNFPNSFYGLFVDVERFNEVGLCNYCEEVVLSTLSSVTKFI